MAYESNGTVIVDEIDRLFVVCDKAKEYLNKIASGIDQQVDLWQYRRQIILDQMNSASSFDFLVPKTQRINELTIEAVQALCRVDLLVEQILRIDPKSATQPRTIPPSASFSARSTDTNTSYSTATASLSRARIPAPSPALHAVKQQPHVERTFNAKPTSQSPFPMPVLRTSQRTGASRLSLAATQEKAGFKPIEQHQQQQSSINTDNTSRPTPIHPQNNHFTASEATAFPRSTALSYGTRTPPSDNITSPLAASSSSHILTSYRQTPRDKVKVKLQRIPPGTEWKQAKIEIIDSLSAFYVENCDVKVHERFSKMLHDLHEHYDNLERSSRLVPLQNVSIGDFGVAKYDDDMCWYRARLLACEEQDQIRIVYIDFGNIETKSMDEFFPLDQAYADLPAQAIACSLSEAFPCSSNENEPLWPQETIQIFRNEVMNKDVKVLFVNAEEGTPQWPLHFVRLTVDNQFVTSLMNLKQRIEPRPNHFIAEKFQPALTHQEYILFNVPISDEEAE